MEATDTMIKGAIISECTKYRYQLWRLWDETKPLVMFIMLNPSIADADMDDPTIRRCINYAKAWGYGGLYVGNLYAYRATDPKDLFKADEPLGEYNHKHLQEMYDKCEKTVCAWGVNQGRPERIVNKFDNLYYLALCKDGTPKHPLYLKKELEPIPFE